MAPNTKSAACIPTAACHCPLGTSRRAWLCAQAASPTTSSGPTRTEIACSAVSHENRFWRVETFRRRAAVGVRRGGEPAYKPSSVPRLASRRRSSISGRRLPDGSSGRPEDWAARPLPSKRPVARAPEPRPPIWPCSEQSLPRFTYRARVHPEPGYVSVALVLASRRTGVTRYPALGSSDFPHARRLPG